MQIMHGLPPHHALVAEYRSDKLKEERLARIIDLEDRIYERAAGVVDAFLAYHEVLPNQEEAPPDWIEQYGLEGARQRLHVAKSGWMPQSHAPAAPKLAVQVMAGISRGRAWRGAKLTQNNLNVQLTLPAPTSASHPSGESYPTKEVE